MSTTRETAPVPTDLPPRLVFGDDGSEAADVAWLWISQHRWTGWRLDVLTAVAPWAESPVGAGPEPRVWTPPHPRELPGADPEGIDQVTHLIAGADPRLALAQPGAGLVVVGHRGRGVLKAMTIGSTADWLLHRPPAPLVIVRSARPVRHVLLCFDGSAHARAAADVLAALPWIEGVRVSVLGVDLHAAPLELVVPQPVGALEAAGARVDVLTRQALVASDVRTTVLEVARELDVDLVALGTRGLGLGRRILLGSVASAVAHHAPCSVLTVMAEEPVPE